MSISPRENDWRFKPASECKSRTTPDWLRKGSIYQIQLRSFTKEGTIAAATERLEWIASLGTNIVYLSPVTLADDDMDKAYWSPRQIRSGTAEPRNPYRVKDYFAVDPEYGNDADLHAFIDKAHGLGLKVLFDVVYYHCGPTAVFLKEHPGFIFRTTEDTVPSNICWHFPPLNFASIELCRYLWSNLEYWVRDFDVDGFRCDVADMVPLGFWETARARLDAIKPDIAMLAEASQPEDHVFAFDVTYCFPFFNRAMSPLAHGKINASEFRGIYDEIKSGYPAGSLNLRYFENHDIVTDDGPNRTQLVYGNDACEALLALCYTLDGVPFIFNGQEIADTSVLKMFEKSPIDWNRSDSDDAKRRLRLVRALTSLRKRFPSLSDGETSWIESSAPDQVVAFSRTHEGRALCIYVNFSNEDVSLKDSGTMVLSRRADTADGSFRLSQYGFAVLCTAPSSSYEALPALEADLHGHIHLENNILFPRSSEQ